ncbi:MAG TPA: flagellar assembly protein FliW [Cellulomonas sp.]
MNGLLVPRRVVGTSAGTSDLPAHLHLVEPLPGLPAFTEYALDALDEIGFLFALRARTDAGDVRLFVVSPGLVFPGYSPAIPGTVLDAVCGRDGERDVVLLTVVHPGPGDRLAPTANLLAPLVADRATGRALQAVLDEDLPLRAPLA